MTQAEIARIRLTSQNIGTSGFTNALELVSWMGAVQAQDFTMSQWAVGLRCPGSTADEILLSFNRGDFIRTHVMRPTWHLIPAEDIYWMLELTAPQIRAATRTRHKLLGLDEKSEIRCFKIIEKEIGKEDNATREALSDAFRSAGIENKDNRYAHILLRAEIAGLICSGQVSGGRQTYTLLQERVPNKKILTREESLAELALRYFRSHGPATLKDFAWWSGLPAKDARLALELVKDRFVSEQVEGKEYWFSDIDLNGASRATGLHLLPAYDEFLVGYSDRSASIPPAIIRKTVSVNGIFYPVIVVDGVVAGLWKRILRKDRIAVEAKFFQKPPRKITNQFNQKVKEFRNFFKKETTVKLMKERNDQ